MAAPPFKVKALYEYKSEHGDDLSFPQSQVITVTEEEDDDWYVGEYTDAAGESQTGLFPKNFVEKYEPAPPPRPTRSRPKPAEPPAEPAPPAAAQPDPEPTPERPPAQREEPEPPVPVAASKPPLADPEPPPAPKPVEAKPMESAPPAKKAPPPVAAKSNAFKDRIAAFNKPAAAPVAPFKPSSGSSSFIKKPFVAPPPARDSYVPPPREPVQQKVYRRDEDPEIAERRAQDDENARQAGLTGASQQVAEGEEEDAPKPTSLKDRIAMLQKQQMEQAQRQAQAGQKEKPKRPPKKRTESHDREEGEGAGLDKVLSGEQTERPSMDSSRELPPAPARKLSQPAAPEPEPFSDGGNDADQSAAGETTEDAGGSSTSVDDDDERRKRHPAAPSHEANVGDEEDDEGEGEEEEDEEDEETARQNRLRARMAALSGAGRGGGMFNPMGFNPMAGMGGPPPKKKAASRPERRATEDEEQAQPTPIPGMPRGMALPGMGPPKASEPAEEDDEEEDTRQAVHPAEEDEAAPAPAPPSRTSTGRSVPPVPSSAPGGAPPVPGGRPSLDGSSAHAVLALELTNLSQLDLSLLPPPQS